MTHSLQTVFATEAGERAYVAEIAALITDVRLEDASAKLLGDLDQLNSRLAGLCKGVRPQDVVITGWEDAIDTLSQYEGEPITAIAISMYNELESAMDVQEAYEPVIDLSFFTDEAFPFSTSSRDQIQAENTSVFTPWQPHAEDIEAYLEIEGLADLNQALFNHKHRVFQRVAGGAPMAYRRDELGNLIQDVVVEATGDAPDEYIAFVLAGLLRTTRFAQAVQRMIEELGVPGGAPVILATHNMRPFAGTVLYAEKRVELSAPSLVGLTVKRAPASLIERADTVSGADIRKQLGEMEERVVAPVSFVPGAVAPLGEPMPEIVPEVPEPEMVVPVQPVQEVEVEPEPKRPSFFRRLFGLK
jgi:hypothetical protein